MQAPAGVAVVSTCGIPLIPEADALPAKRFGKTHNVLAAVADAANGARTWIGTVDWKT